MSEKWEELPEGWEIKPLGEICDITGGGTPRREEEIYFGGPIPWATPTDIHPEETLLISKTKTTITELGLKESSARLLKPGTVLFSSRASIGKIAIASVPMATNQGFANLTPRNGLDSKFLAYGLKFLTDEIKKLGSGTTFIEVPKSALREFEFPFPPLPEQHRIVEKIERLLAESRTARKALDRVPALLKRFRQSVLAKAFRGELTEPHPLSPSPDEEHVRRGGTDEEPASVLLERIREERRRKWEAGKGARGKKYVEPEPPDTSDLPELPEGWCWTTVEEIGSVEYEPVKTGPFGAQLSSKEFTDSGVPILAIGNVQWGKLSLEKQDFITEQKAHQLEVYRLKAGDVLFTRSGTVGRSAVVPKEAEGWLMSYHLLRVRVDSRTCLPEYLYYIFRGEEGIQEEISDRARGATRAGFNTTLLKTLSIPLAPLAEQRRIVAKIEGLFAQGDAIERAVEVARRRAEKVDQAVLARAFRGEL